VIQPATEGKGRSFRATLISSVESKCLWDGGQTDATRPIWMMLAGSENELRPFVANLRIGKKAETLGNGYRRRGAEKLEILKSCKFQCVWQRYPEGCTATLFEPTLFRLDPGMVDPLGVSFCILFDREWVSRVPMEPKIAQYIVKHFPKVPGDKIEHLMRLAPLFVAYLDRRTRCPLIPDPRFYAQILCGALENGLASLEREADKYYNSYYDKPWGVHSIAHETYRPEDAGILTSLAMKTDHPTLEEFLAEQVQIYFKNVESS
jgi:hypothetical protein